MTATVTDLIPSGRRKPPPEQLPPGTVGFQALVELGLSYRQVDYWTRLGYLHAIRPDVGSGKLRLWPESEVRVAARMGRLVRAGVSPADAERVARGGELAPGITVTFTGEHPHG